MKLFITKIIFSILSLSEFLFNIEITVFTYPK